LFASVFDILCVPPQIFDQFHRGCEGVSHLLGLLTGENALSAHRAPMMRSGQFRRPFAV
jgi:hypothetical protein